MGNQLPKVYENGKMYNKCPVCGGACYRYAWNEWKHCNACHELIEKGMPLDQVRSYRMMDRNQDVEDKDLQTIDQLKRKQITTYDFLKKLPPGVNVVANDKVESNILKEAYERYAYNTDNIPEFNVLINNILTGVLESYRISKRLSIITDDKERRSLLEIHNKVSIQINQSTKMLDDIKLNRLAQSTSVLNKEFGKMLKYLKQHGDEYHGVGICDDCNTRIMFKTNFPTFKTRYLETLQTHIDDMLEIGYDKVTLNEIKTRIHKELTDDSLADTYAIKFKRQLEKSLM
jgi:hypothetical protein